MKGEGDAASKAAFGTALMLGLAYSASIGGMMTLVGTSTNVMFKGYFEQNYGLEIDFLDWMMVGVPIGITLLAIVWWMLTFVLFPCEMIGHKGIGNIIDKKLDDLGKMSTAEIRTLLVFVLTASLWIGKGLIEPFLGGLVLNDASIAIFGAILLFVIPVDWRGGRFSSAMERHERCALGNLTIIGRWLGVGGCHEQLWRGRLGWF